ncbi:MAG: beta-N-acetylhexosaminidase [Nitrospinota bacterium]|nr:beta-N-acetylhexosaminidase [Nitrospinota bacterium]
MQPLSTKEQAGQLLISGFEGTTLNPEIEDLILNRSIGGIILFDRNYENPDQLYELIRNMQTLALEKGSGIPLFISVDQEGGRVSRLKAPFSDFPFQRCLGKAKSQGLAFRFGQTLARELKAVGINMDFAPVLDVNTNPGNPVIGDRALSTSSEWTARLGASIIRGFQSVGVLPVGKHFPGHGDTNVDSHEDLPFVQKDADTLEDVELFPFAFAVHEGLDALMTAHVMYPAWDDKYPATFSRLILDDILRRRLGFEGLIISDDLEMNAIEKHFSFESIPAFGLNAGLDLFMICNNLEKTSELHELTVKEIEQGHITTARLQKSLARIKKIKEKVSHPVFPNTPPDFSTWSARHQKLVAEMKAYL